MTLKTEVAEFVLPGHPDKLCDAAVDAIVQFIRERDPRGQCGLEAACIFNKFFLTGRIAAHQFVLAQLDVQKIVREIYRSAGYGKDAAGYLWGPSPDEIEVTTALCWGPFEEGERELRHLSDDQAICIGYANAMEETNHLPPAHWLANRIGRELFRLRVEKGAAHVGPDAKVITRVETDGRRWQPIHVSISLNHHLESDWQLLRQITEEAVNLACRGKEIPMIELNGAGMFISGGPNGDNGLSGKKLVVDAYGPSVPIGGGAWSGKDLNKVDRLGGYLARMLALRTQQKLGCREVLVTLSYTPGCAEPASVVVTADQTQIRYPFGAKEIALENAQVSRLLDQQLPPLVDIARWGILDAEQNSCLDISTESSLASAHPVDGRRYAPRVTA
jgi:S-adenosylmethionine synthetase